jgi:hypothetical protein
MDGQEDAGEGEGSEPGHWDGREVERSPPEAGAFVEAEAVEVSVPNRIKMPNEYPHNETWWRDQAGTHHKHFGRADESASLLRILPSSSSSGRVARD